MTTLRALATTLAFTLAACGEGTTGLVDVSLTTAPGSTVLDGVQTLRMTLTNPRRVIEATRTGRGFDLVLDIDADEAGSALLVEGLDAAGALVAYGQAPLFPISAINTKIVVYVAPPMSINAAPIALATARSHIAGAPLDYGAVFAGGLTADGAPTTDIAVYNAYNHTLVSGIPLPAARADLAMVHAGNGLVYLFGGTGADGNPTGTLWRFDTTVAPNGAFSTVTDQPTYARAGQRIVTVPSTAYAITGSPALDFNGAAALTARTDLPSLPPAGATAAGTTAIFVGDTIIRRQAASYDTLSPSGRVDAAVVKLPDATVAVVGGGEPLTRDALRIDAATGAITTVADALQTPRRAPSIAATSRHVVVAGGTDANGDPIATAEILDAATLAPIAVVPITARSGSYAVALPNDQVLLVGGAPASALIELFTPGPP